MSMARLRGQLVGISSLLPHEGARDQIQVSHIWLQVPLPAEPSYLIGKTHLNCRWYHSLCKRSWMAYNEERGVGSRMHLFPGCGRQRQTKALTSHSRHASNDLSSFLRLYLPIGSPTYQQPLQNGSKALNTWIFIGHFNF